MLIIFESFTTQKSAKKLKIKYAFYTRSSVLLLDAGSYAACTGRVTRLNESHIVLLARR
jgi:hypothetical protein